MNFSRNLLLWIVIALLVLALFNLFQGAPQRGPHASPAYSEFLAEVDSGQIREVTIKGNEITGKYQDGRGFVTYAPSDDNLIPLLTEKGVGIRAAPAEDGSPIWSILLSWFPMLLLVMAGSCGT